MQIQETIIYCFIFGAFLAVGWMFMPRGREGADLEGVHGRNWGKMPLVFKATWGFVDFFAESLGVSMSALMPNRAKRMTELAGIAALPLSANHVMAASFTLGTIGALLGVAAASVVYSAVPSVWAGFGVLMVVAFFAMGWFWPSQSLAHYAEMRQLRLTRELPFAIDLIGSAMRSGLEFGAAMRYYVALGTGGPLEEELGRVLAEAGIGSTYSKALGDMAERIKVDAFTTFAGVIAYGSEIGAPIAQTLKMHGGDLRRARFAVAERKAARAPSIMILPLVFFIMPSVFIIVLTPMVLRLKAAF